MNYVYEELMRQQAALAALFGSGHTEMAREEMERASKRREFGEGTSWAVLSDAEDALAEIRGADLGKTARWVSTFSGMGEAADAGTDLPTALAERAVNRQMMPRVPRVGKTDVPAQRGRLGGFLGSGRREIAADGRSAGGWREVGAVPRAAAGGADVRAVSRAIQRDARRYDGGFTIY